MGHLDDDAGPVPPPKRATMSSWLIAALLAICYTVAYVDRQVISLLIRPIKATLGISDTQVGLLQGVSFSLFYVAAALPLVWLADHTRRSRVMSGCVAFWSAMTMACGVVTGFWPMMLARIGVATGEAGITPAALATLSERFGRRQLAVATSFYMLAPFVGGGLAPGAGGAVFGWAQGIDRSAHPLVASFEDWQIVFLLVGAIGIPPSLLLLLIRDRAIPGMARRQANLADVFALFARDWRILVLYQFAMAIMMIVLAGYVT